MMANCNNSNLYKKIIYGGLISVTVGLVLTIGIGFTSKTTQLNN
jgi:hypothetical protein